jgi:hypothetical protein
VNRHGDVQQAEIDDEFTPVVVPMIETHRAHHADAGHRSELAIARRQPPDVMGTRGVESGEEVTRRGQRRLERREQSRYALAGGVFKSPIGHVQAVELGQTRHVAGNRGDVLGQLTGAERLGMRPPVKLVGGQALQDAAGGRGFGVEFGDQSLGGGQHDVSSQWK